MSGNGKWYTDIAEAMTGRMLAYLQAGALSRSVHFEEDIRNALENRGFEVHRVDWTTAAEHGWESAFPPAADVGPGKVFLLWKPESIADRRDFEEILRQSRPKGQAAIAAGARLIVVSARPKLSFPEPDGSSIIADCSRLRPISVDADRLQSMHTGLEPSAAERIVGFADGTVALSEYYLQLEVAKLSGNEKRRQAGQFLHAILSQAVDELGVGILALLDHLVLGCDTLDLPEEDLAAHQIAALESANLLRVNDLDRTVHLFAEPWRAEVKDCLAVALRSVVSPPPEWELLARKTFTFERRARKLVMEMLIELHGKDWRHALGERGAKAFGLARMDTNMSASSLDDIYTPLDWFLLEDLLDLAAEISAEHGSIRGVRAGDWARLRSQVIPIRNRVAHVRLPLETDGTTMRSALLILDARTRAFESTRDSSINSPAAAHH
ncbi:hypothetical protein [Verrucosispora sp. NA02020]|uniref:hypothetical protein n=1 Tax=Verrucosispora sp. NA02020 TaxID=2742132 RepID=UPI003D75680B